MTSTAERQDTRQDAFLHKSLGYWSLVAIGLGSVIGSGWLLASMYAAQAAGPAALLAWVIAGLLMLFIALVFAELAIAKPESGGLVRYPLYSNGRFAAAIVGWSMWVAYVGNPPTEAAAAVQYSSSWLDGVYNGTKLTTWGILLSIGLMAVFVVINYFGVALFAKTNNIVTAVKILLPTTTVVLLIVSGFSSSNFSDHGGAAPYGWGTALGTIATAGMVFAYTGFRNIVELSGEVRDPRRDIPRALVTTIVLTIVLYLGLQIAFLGAVPGHDLVHGWSGVNFDSPFAQLALMLNLTWLYWLLIADSTVSPSGSGVVYTAANARNVFGLGKNGFFPRWLMKVDRRTGVPSRALIVNFVIGIAFLLPLPSWHSIIEVTGTLAVFTFAIGSVSLYAFREVGLTEESSRLPWMGVLSPAAFVISALVIYWVGWDDLVKTVPIVAAGLVVYAITYVVNKDGVADLAGGVWLVGFLVAEYVLSKIGSFGGFDWIPSPWDSVVVAVVAAAIYVWGVRSGVAFMRGRPAETEALKREAESDLGVAPGR